MRGGLVSKKKVVKADSGTKVIPNSSVRVDPVHLASQVGESGIAGQKGRITVLYLVLCSPRTMLQFRIPALKSR